MKLRQIKKQAYAVSPVIATLMLVLVSVGSAGVFYVWQSNWQEGTTDSIEDTDVKATLQLGGSSTVYPVTVDAAEAFMNEFPQYKVETKGGGSDSGIIGAGEGILDIGAASKNPSSSDFEKYPDLHVTTIGYDGVVLITKHNEIVAMNATTLKAIYAVNGELTDDDTLKISLVENGSFSENFKGWFDGTQFISWKNVTTFPGSGVNCTGDTPIKVYDRADKSGTEECFCEKLMDKEFGKQISPNAVNAKSVDSNQELIQEIKADSNALGFMAYGIAKDESDLNIIEYAPYHAPGYSNGDETTDDYTEDADNDENCSGIPNFADIGSGVYKGSRPLNYLTNGEPTGLEANFIQYVLWTQNNKDFMHDNAYVSIYD